MKADKLTVPRWHTAETCKHEFVQITEPKNGRPYSQGMNQYRCRRCGYRKASRHA